MTISAVMGLNRQKGEAEIYRGAEWGSLQSFVLGIRLCKLVKIQSPSFTEGVHRPSQAGELISLACFVKSLFRKMS